MNDEKKEIAGGGSDKGFAVRMTVWLGLLTLVVAGLVYDRVILPSMAKSTIENAYKLMVAPDEDGHGITQERVRATIGFDPVSETSEVDGRYKVERYEFKRALPWAKGNFLNVIYEDDALVQILQDQEFSQDKVEVKFTYRTPDKDTYKGMPVQLGFGGAGDGGGDDDDDEDDEGVEEDDDRDDGSSDEDEEGVVDESDS